VNEEALAYWGLLRQKQTNKHERVINIDKNIASRTREITSTISTERAAFNRKNFFSIGNWTQSYGTKILTH